MRVASPYQRVVVDTASKRYGITGHAPPPGTIASGGFGGHATLNDCLVAYWRLDETSGDALDATGNNHTLTDVNTVTTASGKINTARQFTLASSESFLMAADHAAFDVGATQNFTVTCWVYLDSLDPSSSPRIAMHRASRFPDRGWWLGYFAGNEFQFTVTNSTNSVAASNFPAGGTIATGTWYFLAGRCYAADSPKHIKLDVNAVTVEEKFSADAWAEEATAKLRMGRQDSAAWFMDGRIDEAAYFDCVLSDAEITALYNGGAGLPY